jgi:hypothetical protein
MRLSYFWINQPSTLQPDHQFDGRRVLADFSTGTRATADGQLYVDVYFLDEPVSMRMSTLSLSPGWGPR